MRRWQIRGGYMPYRRSLECMLLHRSPATIFFAVLLIGIFCSLQTGKSQWIRQDVLSDATMLLTTDFAGLNVGAAAGYIENGTFDGRAIYTSDGGALWIPASVP